MARRLVFTDSGFWKYSWAHLVMSMTESCRWVMQCRLRARRPRASNKGFRHCPLRTEISQVSLKLLMMLCTVDDEFCKAFAIWRWGTLFLKYSTIFLHSFTDWRASAHLYFWETLPLQDIPFMLQTWCQLTLLVARCSPSWIFSKFLAFSALCCPRANFFETCSRHQIWNEHI